MMHLIGMSITRLMPLAAIMSIVGCERAAPPARTGPMAAAVAYTEGDTLAPVKFIYFDDLVCDDCMRFSAAAAEPLRTQWVATKKLHLTVVDLAWHRGSVAGSAAMRCAADQGKFWEMHELLFDRQDVWKREVDIPAKLQTYAEELHLTPDAFRACAAKKEHQTRLDAADGAARQYGVRGTPAFIVNDKPFFGNLAWPYVEQVLTAYLNGTPDKIPPPPMTIPMKKVVDSVKLKEKLDSVQKAAGKKPD